MQSVTYFQAPFGTITIHCKQDAITSLDLSYKTHKQKSTKLKQNDITKQIKQYFAKQRTTFSIPYLIPMHATSFQKRVWKAISKIPYGKTATYGDLAKQLASSPRAVGNACGKNPVPLLIPCHRVVAKNSIGGFSGIDKQAKEENLKIKSFLLNLER